VIISSASMAQQNPKKLEVDWKTDTSKRIVPLEEFTALLMPDGIPPIDKPEFWDVHRASQAFFELEPVIIIELAGEELTYLSSMIISLGEFIETYPEGLVLSTNTGHDMQYGTNPYTGYDNLENTQPRLFKGEVDSRLPAMERVVDVQVDGKYKINGIND